MANCVAYGQVQMAIVAVRHYCGRVNVGELVCLKREPHSVHDHRALKVTYHGWHNSKDRSAPRSQSLTCVLQCGAGADQCARHTRWDASLARWLRCFRRRKTMDA